jgi:hypothetical protein
VIERSRVGVRTRLAILVVVVSMTAAAQAADDSCCLPGISHSPGATSVKAPCCYGSDCQALERETPRALLAQNGIVPDAAGASILLARASPHGLGIWPARLLPPGSGSPRTSRTSLVLLHAQLLI